MEVIDLLVRGDWEAAHTIVQPDKSAEASWLHGIVHTIEGDLENAQHWYRKAKRPFPGPTRSRPRSRPLASSSGERGRIVASTWLAPCA